MTQKNILITGGSGYLGRFLAAKIADDFAVHVTAHAHPQLIAVGTAHQLDLTDADAVQTLVARVSPDAIIHTAAINPGSGDEQTMMRVNADGSRHIAQASVAIGARLVHVSTDALHDGKHAPYHDDAPPSPIHAYGRSKAAAEAAVESIAPSAAIVRTSLIYGLRKMDRGTAGFVEKLQSGEELLLFEDHIRQPVWIETLAEALLTLAFDAADFAGKINVVGEQVLTRAQFARRMFDWWEVANRHRAKSGLAADLPSGYASDLRLTTDRARRVLDTSLPGVDEAISIAKNT